MDNFETNWISPRTPKLSLRVIELLIWLVIAVVVSYRPLMYLSLNGSRGLFEFYYEFLFGLFIFLFPFLFRLIFGLYPFEQIRRTRQLKFEYKIDNDITSAEKQSEILEKLEKSITRNDDTEIKPEELTNLATKSISKKEDLSILSLYVRQSQNISEKIYTRSGVYLLIGCLIAFAGVLFFYFQSAYLHNITADSKKPFDFSRTLLDFLPRLGTLIFVEAIAFFFLKQYRTTIEEFRYYEAIKRQRENQYAVYNIASNSDYTVEQIDKIIEKCGFNENPNKLTQNETTQIIEASKISSADIDIFDKLIEIIKVAKK